MQSLYFELRYTIRSLLNNPLSTLVAVGMLALGLGLVLFMCGVIQSFVLREPPFPDPHRIAHFELINTQTGAKNVAVGLHTYLDIARDQEMLDPIGAYYGGTVSYTKLPETEPGSGGSLAPYRRIGAYVTADVFRVLDVAPLLGRDFLAEDFFPGAQPVVMLSHSLWEDNFMSDDEVIGRPLYVNGEIAVIIGVMPEGFRFPEDHDMWVPLDLNVPEQPRDSGIAVQVIGRMGGGVTVTQVQEDFQDRLDRIIQDYGSTGIVRGNVVDIKALPDEVVPEIYQQVLAAMLLAVILVLLVACANVAGLLSARSATRQQERVMRSVLGATPARLLWSGILEAGVIALVAAGVGLGIATVAGDWFMRQLATLERPPPSWMLEFRIDSDIILLTFLCGLLTALLAGLMPAWRAARTAPSQVMREGGAGAIQSGLGRMGRHLVTMEIALSLVLLVGAGLVVRTVMNIQNIEVGADTHNVFTGRLALLEERYQSDAGVTSRFLDTLQKDLAANSAIEMATVGNTLPMTQAVDSPVSTERLGLVQSGSSPHAGPPRAVPLVVANNYFSFFRIPVLRGRMFNDHDRGDTTPVVVISTELAQALWPKENPVGNQLWVNNSQGEPEVREVVGIVGEVEYDGEDLNFSSGHEGVRGAYYVPLQQSHGSFWSLAVKVRDRSGWMNKSPYVETVEGIIENAVRQGDRYLPVYWKRTLDDWIELAGYRHRLVAGLFGTFGLIALGLTATGLYALLAYAVACKTREIGVRRALGAPSWRIIQTILHENMMQLVIGAAVGLVLSIGFALLLKKILFNVSPFDPVTFLTAVLVFAVCCLFASLVPAFKAIRIAPMQALRYE